MLPIIWKLRQDLNFLPIVAFGRTDVHVVCWPIIHLCWCWCLSSDRFSFAVDICVIILRLELHQYSSIRIHHPHWFAVRPQRHYLSSAIYWNLVYNTTQVVSFWSNCQPVRVMTASSLKCCATNSLLKISHKESIDPCKIPQRNYRLLLVRNFDGSFICFIAPAVTSAECFYSSVCPSGFVDRTDKNIAIVTVLS